MITIFIKEEIELKLPTPYQISTIADSDFVFVIDVEEMEYECIKDKENGESYIGELEDFNSDVADRIMNLQSETKNEKN